MDKKPESNLKEYTELQRYFTKGTLDLVTAKSEEEFDEAFDHWLTDAISKLESGKKEFQSLSEDGISHVLAYTLSTPELSVTREQNSNGHVDLTVTLVNSTPKRIKLGEAKIWKGSKYHVSGLGQLLNRYTTGRESRGFVIAYVRKKNVKGVFEKLRKHIDKNKSYNLKGICEDHTIKWSFLSHHKHNSGEKVSVCHLGCNLYIEK